MIVFIFIYWFLFVDSFISRYFRHLIPPAAILAVVPYGVVFFSLDHLPQPAGFFQHHLQQAAANRAGHTTNRAAQNNFIKVEDCHLHTMYLHASALNNKRDRTPKYVAKRQKIGMGHIFWDNKGLTDVQSLEQGGTVGSAQRQGMATELHLIYKYLAYLNGSHRIAAMDL